MTILVFYINECLVRFIKKASPSVRKDYPFYYGVVSRIVAAAPSEKAPSPVITCMDSRSHWLTEKLAPVNPQHGPVTPVVPVTPAMIPVAVGPVAPQVLSINIWPDAKTPAPIALSRVLKIKPVIVEFCPMTTVFRIKLADALPSPKNWPFPIG